VSDRKALWKAIAKHPREDTPKLALADWFAEHGGPVDGSRMYFAIRWCVANRKWPAVVERNDAIWWVMNGAPGRHTLHPAIFRMMPGCRQHYVIFSHHGSAEAAIRALARVLTKLRNLCEVPT